MAQHLWPASSHRICCTALVTLMLRLLHLQCPLCLYLRQPDSELCSEQTGYSLCRFLNSSSLTDHGECVMQFIACRLVATTSRCHTSSFFSKPTDARVAALNSCCLTTFVKGKASPEHLLPLRNYFIVVSYTFWLFMKSYPCSNCNHY